MACVVQPAAAEKLRREVARLTGELERVEKEVQRQKGLRCAYLHETLSRFMHDEILPHPHVGFHSGANEPHEQAGACGGAAPEGPQVLTAVVPEGCGVDQNASHLSTVW